MSAQRGPSQRFSLWRWSRRKLEAEAAPAAAVPATAAPAELQLPPVESLTFDSDFALFLRPEVDDQVKRAALKQLFKDPRFNVMDGLDTYIDDYTLADPIAPDVLADLLQRGFGDAAQASPESASDAAAWGTVPAVTAEPPSATAQGSASALTPVQPASLPASGNDTARVQQAAQEVRVAGASDGEPSHPKRSDVRS